MSSFKDYSKNILTKLLLGLLVVSFVLFGISSFLLEGSNSWVAKIDGRKISIQSFQQNVNIERNFLMQRNQENPEIKKYLSSARFQIDVLSKMLNEEIIETIAQRYGIKNDRSSILREITKDQNFHRNGKFNHRFFKNILAANGLTEESYIQSIANEYSKFMTLDSINIVSPIDQFHSEAIANLKEQLRYADQIVISENRIKNIKRPSKDDLEKIYQTNLSQFQQDESRNISVLAINKNDITKNVRVYNKEVKEFYENNIGKFQTGERRDFLHISFDKKEQAEEFFDKLENSKKDKKLAFYKIAKEDHKKSKNQVLIKDISQNDSLPEITSRLFKFNLVGDYSKVFRSDLGFHVILLDNITTSSPIKYSKLKSELKSQLLDKKKSEKLNSEIAAINSYINSSQSLEKTAKKFSLRKPKYANNISIIPAKKDRKIIKDLRKNNAIFDKIFTMQSGKISNILEGNDKFFAIEIKKVKPSRIRSKKEVMASLKKIYYSKAKKQKALELAQNISKEIFENPRSFRKIAIKSNVRLKKYKKFKRYNVVTIGKQKIKQQTEFLNNLFDIKVNQATNYFYNNKTKSYEIALLRKISTPKFDLDTKHEHFTELSNSYREEFMEVFNRFIEKEHNVKINSKFIESLQKESINE